MTATSSRKKKVNTTRKAPVRKLPEELKAIMDRQSKKDKLKKITKKEAQLIHQAESAGESFSTSNEYIEKNINIAMKVAEHLWKIREYKLYRLEYNTFEDYVRDKLNYTRSRAYQLVRAHELATYINGEIQEGTLTTEPQCRELLRLKIYEDSDSRKENKEKSNAARLKIVKNVLDKNNFVKTSGIVAETEKAIDQEIKKHLESASKESCQHKIESSFKVVTTRLNKMFTSKEWASDDKEALKNKAIKELEALLKQIKAK